MTARRPTSFLPILLVPLQLGKKPFPFSCSLSFLSLCRASLLSLTRCSPWVGFGKHSDSSRGLLACLTIGLRGLKGHLDRRHLKMRIQGLLKVVHQMPEMALLLSS